MYRHRQTKIDRVVYAIFFPLVAFLLLPLSCAKAQETDYRAEIERELTRPCIEVYVKNRGAFTGTTEEATIEFLMTEPVVETIYENTLRDVRGKDLRSRRALYRLYLSVCENLE